MKVRAQANPNEGRFLVGYYATDYGAQTFIKNHDLQELLDWASQEGVSLYTYPTLPPEVELQAQGIYDAKTIIIRSDDKAPEPIHSEPREDHPYMGQIMQIDPHLALS